ncbi:uncharacterized protein LOC108962386 isoform X4 [Serinus canaria]|uniref:uncharacterized protein LOC108962386 isoform X4 n=1 Tax=Serinus canaria TaxID=9135 RepID=UPI0021CC74A6|nr:uncharacterized protein LOC108962386 isoform X4 [Serinus canaria]
MRAPLRHRGSPRPERDGFVKPPNQLGAACTTAHPRGKLGRIACGNWLVDVRPRFPQCEQKPCTCLTYSGFSWPAVNTSSCVRTRGCGLAAAGRRQAAPAPFSGTCKSLGLPGSQLQLSAFSGVSVAANHHVH